MPIISPAITGSSTSSSSRRRWSARACSPTDEPASCVEKSAGELALPIGGLVEWEVAGVDDVHLGVGNVTPVCLGLGHFEGWVVTAPHHQQRRERLAVATAANADSSRRWGSGG